MTFIEAVVRSDHMNEMRTELEVGEVFYYAQQSPHVQGEWIISELTNEDTDNE